MLATARAARQARSYDRSESPRPDPAVDGLALLPGRTGDQLPDEGPRHPAAARPDRLGQRVLQPATTDKPWARRAVALALDPAAAGRRSRLRAGVIAAVAQIECAARMAHNAAPTQKLKGNE